MFTYEFVLSIALLSTPANEPISGEESMVLAIRPSIIAAALDMQILDARERDHYLGLGTVEEKSSEI